MYAAIVLGPTGHVYATRHTRRLRTAQLWATATCAALGGLPVQWAAVQGAVGTRFARKAVAWYTQPSAALPAASVYRVPR